MKRQEDKRRWLGHCKLVNYYTEANHKLYKKLELDEIREIQAMRNGIQITSLKDEVDAEDEVELVSIATSNFVPASEAHTSELRKVHAVF